MPNHPRNELGLPYDGTDLLLDAKNIVTIARELANHVETLIAHNTPAGMCEMHLPFALTAARRLEKLIRRAHEGAVVLAPGEFERAMGRAA